VLGKTECPLCQVALTEDDPSQLKGNWSLVADYDERFASLVEGALEQAGIECRTENLSLTVPAMMGLAKVEIWVKEEDLGRTRRLLQETEEQHLFCSDCYAVVFPDDEFCPNCGADFED
jgi:hypothetical protein